MGRRYGNQWYRSGRNEARPADANDCALLAIWDGKFVDVLLYSPSLDAAEFVRSSEAVSGEAALSYCDAWLFCLPHDRRDAVQLATDPIAINRIQGRTKMQTFKR